MGTQPPIHLTSAPVSFYFFKTKKCPQITSFLDFRNIQKSVTDMLKATSVEYFKRCYQKWEQRLHRCVADQGNYFEGDIIDDWKK